MRIGIDITAIKDQFGERGVGYYTKEVTAKLINAHPEHEWVLFGFETFESNLSLLGIRKDPSIKFVSLGKIRTSSPANILFFKFTFLPKIIAAKLDIFFAPHFERGLPIGKVKTVVVMHDIIPLVTNKFSSKGSFINKLKGWYYKRAIKIAKKADLIITDSDFSARELANKAGFDEHKIKKIFLGIKDIFREVNIPKDTRDIRRVLMIYKISKPYILHYGGLEANKNVNSLLYSFKNVIKRFPETKLVLVGKDFKVGWDNRPQAMNERADEVLRICEEIKIKHNVMFTGNVDEQHLPIIMKNAEVFVALSSYEGFGFSALEALASGVPVVAARRSCYPEVLEDAVEFVNPDDVEKVSNAIISVLDEPQVKEKLIPKGLRLVTKYTWDNCAQETFNALQEEYNKIPKLHVGFLTPNFYPFNGGAESNSLALAKSLVKNGHKVTVLTTDSNNKDWPSEEVYEGINIRRFRKLNKQYYLGFTPGLFWGLMSAKFDILHVHGFGFIWFDFILKFKRFFNPKLIIVNTPHGPFMANQQYSLPKKILRSIYIFIQRFYLNWLYKVVFQVNPVQYKWITQYGISQNKIKFLPNGIAPSYFDKVVKDSYLTEYKLAKKQVITYIGRFEKYKGVHDIISVMPKLLLTYKNLKLVAMGNEGAYLADIRELISELKLEKSVEILIKPDDETVKGILSVSKIYILPSSWEAFGISILEAMARGNAIVTTRTEGGEFLIKEDENGYLFDYNDQNELYNFIDKLLADKELIKRISEANILKAKEFIWDKITDDYLKMLLDLKK